MLKLPWHRLQSFFPSAGQDERAFVQRVNVAASQLGHIRVRVSGVHNGLRFLGQIAINVIG